MNPRGPSYGWRSTFHDLIADGDTEILSSLSSFVADAGKEQREAWRASLNILRATAKASVLNHPPASDYDAIFEYELPREGGRRPDVVLLENGNIVVLEFKGRAAPTRADLDQVAAYARDLRHYHSECRERRISPVLVPTHYSGQRRTYDDVEVCSPRDLPTLIADRGQDPFGAHITAEDWAAGEYAPLPSIVAAAREIFNGRPLPNIKRAQSSGIPQALERLLSIAHFAARNRQRALILLTGVPGAGKTLAGLQFVHHSSLEDLRSGNSGAPAVFLSGNGPLVEVLRHALKGPSGEEKIFVEGIKRYLKQHLLRKRPQAPPENIIVFDEAQRAWDPVLIRDKHDIDASEPELVIRLADTISDWSAVLGLIGEGQEIHKGEEAGLKQWVEAVRKSERLGEWTAYGPSKLARLFEGSGVPFVSCDELELTVTVRSHLASRLTAWVTEVLEGLPDSALRARAIAEEVNRAGFRMYVTRDIGVAADYVRTRYMNQTGKRFGFLASSRANNLSARGLDNGYQATKKLKVGPWFNDPPNSPFSSCALQSVVTEFQCQGLELDFPIICWGDDLTWTGSSWLAAERRLSKVYKDPRQLRLNSYRVLLTRARDGFIVYAPPDGDGLDKTAQHLEDCGLVPLHQAQLEQDAEVAP